MLEHQKKSKDFTTKKVFRECLRLQEFTGITLKDTLGLSKPTVNEILTSLKNDNLIIENGYVQGDVGRKARVYQINDTSWYSLAIEIDIKKISFALVSLNGNVSYLSTMNDQIFTSENFVEMISKFVKNYLDELPMDTKNLVRSCAISIPGDISFDRKTIIYATNMNLKNIDVTPLEKNLGMTISLENEANCGALAEFYFSKDEEQTTLYISISDEGVGGGYIVDGKLQKGANRKGGEIGHFTISIDGKECSCGNRGCFERYASNQALILLLAENGFHYNSFDEIFNDPTNDEIIKQYCHYLGRGIRSLATILDPHQVVIGGNISKYRYRIEEYIHDEVFSKNNFDSFQNLQINYTKNGDLTSLIGAGLIPFFSMIYDESVYQ